MISQLPGCRRLLPPSQILQQRPEVSEAFPYTLTPSEHDHSVRASTTIGLNVFLFVLFTLQFFADLTVLFRCTGAQVQMFVLDPAATPTATSGATSKTAAPAHSSTPPP